MKAEFTVDDFDDDQWEILCSARLHRNARVWYRCLREWCGYRSPSSPCKRQMERLVDRWLREHPTWVKLYAGNAAQVAAILGSW